MQDSSNYRKNDSSRRVQPANPRGGNFNRSAKPNIVDEWFGKNTFSKDWVEKEVNAAMVTYAEEAGMFMAKNGLTNSKIRSIYGEIKRIQMGKYEDEKTSFLLLRPKVAYAAGRDSHNNGLALFKRIFDEASTYVTNQKSLNNFHNLFEAILAYHKSHGGKD